MAAAAAAVVALLAATAFYQHREERQHSQGLYWAQVQSCQRVNKFRRAVNRAHRQIRSFMQVAYLARLHDYRRTRDPRDRRAADAYRQIVDSITLVPVPNCLRVVSPP